MKNQGKRNTDNFAVGDRVNIKINGPTIMRGTVPTGINSVNIGETQSVVAAGRLIDDLGNGWLVEFDSALLGTLWMVIPKSSLKEPVPIKNPLRWTGFIVMALQAITAAVLFFTKSETLQLALIIAIITVAVAYTGSITWFIVKLTSRPKRVPSIQSRDSVSILPHTLNVTDQSKIEGTPLVRPDLNPF